MLATTKAFLDYFNLKSLDELPPLSALREMEPEPEPPVEVWRPQPPRDDLDGDAIPASIRALADRAIAEAGESLPGDRGEAGEPEKPREETSFRSLLLELDEMGAGPEDRLRRPARPSGALGAGRRVHRASGWADSRGRGASRRACRRGGCRGRRSR